MKMKNLLFIILALGLAVSSCKKKGCTDATALNYDANAKKDDGSCNYPPAYVALCDGISGNNQFLPLQTGRKWTYDRVLGSAVDLYSEEVTGTTVINGLTYFTVYFVNDQFGSTGTFYYRIDPANGDVYKRTGSTDNLLIPGSPTVGMATSNGFTVTSVNASITTNACSYSGCLELSKTSAFGTTKVYFKKGLGHVRTTDLGTNSGDILKSVIL
jgi:hypothetical protein